MSLANPLYFKYQSSLKVSSQGNQIHLGNSALTSPKVEHPGAFYTGGTFSKWTNLSQFALHLPSSRCYSRLISHLYLQSLLQEH